MNRRIRVGNAALAATLLLAGGCLHDHRDSAATLDNVWPNEDGSQWIYELTRHAGGLSLVVYSDPADVPPAPTLSEVVALLESHPIGQGAPAEMGEYGLRFDGLITTGPGVTAQHLVSRYEPPAPAPARVGLGSPLARWLWIARPDLREGMLAGGLRGDLPDEPWIVVSPLFLGGYAWEETGEWIGGYGEFDAELSRLYLEADLAAGHEFRMQLAASVADDVFLHARILPRRSVQTPAGTFSDVVECVYLVDLGVGAITGSTGELLGYLGAFSYGTVLYAPEVGPVASDERSLVDKGDPTSLGAGDLVIRLTDWSLGR